MKENSAMKKSVKRVSRYSKGNPKIRTGKSISTSSSRHESLYKNAKEINKRLSQERNRKEEEEMKACTFHPKISEFKGARGHFRPHSNDIKRKYLLSSLERLIPSRDQLELKNKVSEAHKKKIEQEELDKCTFKPEFVQGIVDWQNKVKNLPGIDNHLKRMRESQDEVQRKKTFFDGLGSKYKGQKTKFEPFDLTKSRHNDISSSSSGVNVSPPLLFHKKAKFRSGKLGYQEVTPGSDLSKRVSTHSSLRNETMNDSKENEKFAKLRIHYRNNKHAEIKVFENTDPDHLAESFCNKYRLGTKMRQQLKSIIIRRLDSLRSQSVIASEHTEEEKESQLEQQDQVPVNNPGKVKVKAGSCLEENTPTNTSGFFNETDHDQNTSALPIPELNISTK